MVLPTLNIENSLWQQGFKYVCGIDEVGRGSWAGPLVAGGVILPQDFSIPQGLADSKLVKNNVRKSLTKIIKKQAIATVIIEIPSSQIDKVGVGKATHIAFRKITKRISPTPDFCIIDAFSIRHYSKNRQLAVKNGDKISASIAAASIVAKVYRDKLMRSLHYKYPQYGFGKHKGYGTALHQKAIKTFGLSKAHRASYNLGYAYA